MLIVVLGTPEQVEQQHFKWAFPGHVSKGQVFGPWSAAVQGGGAEHHDASHPLPLGFCRKA